MPDRNHLRLVKPGEKRAPVEYEEVSYTHVAQFHPGEGARLLEGNEWEEGGVITITQEPLPAREAAPPGEEEVPYPMSWEDPEPDPDQEELDRILLANAWTLGGRPCVHRIVRNPEIDLEGVLSWYVEDTLPDAPRVRVYWYTPPGACTVEMTLSIIPLMEERVGYRLAWLWWGSEDEITEDSDIENDYRCGELIRRGEDAERVIHVMICIRPRKAIAHLGEVMIPPYCTALGKFGEKWFPIRRLGETAKLFDDLSGPYKDDPEGEDEPGEDGPEG